MPSIWALAGGVKRGGVSQLKGCMISPQIGGGGGGGGGVLFFKGKNQTPEIYKRFSKKKIGKKHFKN